jgi:hypothetical protein
VLKCVDRPVLADNIGSRELQARAKHALDYRGLCDSPTPLVSTHSNDLTLAPIDDELLVQLGRAEHPLRESVRNGIILVEALAQNHDHMVGVSFRLFGCVRRAPSLGATLLTRLTMQLAILMD